MSAAKTSSRMEWHCSVVARDKVVVIVNNNLPSPSTAPSSRPVDLTALSERIRMGNNAATVLKSELPVCKATPISYLMYGPFGSFAPAYDSAFATLTKTDSDLLLAAYGNELGISYAHRSVIQE